MAIDWAINSILDGSYDWVRSALITTNAVKLESSVPSAYRLRGLIAKCRMSDEGYVYSEFKRVWSDPVRQTFMFIDDIRSEGSWQLAWKVTSSSRATSWLLQVESSDKIVPLCGSSNSFGSGGTPDDIDLVVEI